MISNRAAMRGFVLYAEEYHRGMEPLAARIRPQKIEDVVGQEHLVGEGKPPDFKNTTNTYYYKSGSSLAHASSGMNMIGWNLRNLSEYTIRNFNDPEVLDLQLQEFYETYSHECAHLLEKGSEFTHNQQFYRQQARALSFLMYANKKEKA